MILAESIFTSIPIKGITEYISNRIYVDGSLTILLKVYFEKATGETNKRIRFTGVLSVVLCLLLSWIFPYVNGRRRSSSYPLRPIFTNFMLITHTYAKRKILMANFPEFKSLSSEH